VKEEIKKMFSGKETIVIPLLKKIPNTIQLL